MKNLAKTTLGIIAVLMLSLAFVQCKDAKMKLIELEAEQMNKQCPMPLGGDLTLTKCSLEDGATLKLHVAVPDEVASQLTITDEMKSTFAQGLKMQPNFDKIKDLGITYAYTFYDSSEKLISEVKVTPEDYK